MKYCIVLIVIFASTLQTQAQLENNNWKFGLFGTTCTFLPTFTIRPFDHKQQYFEQCITLSDPVHSRLMFYGGAEFGSNKWTVNLYEPNQRKLNHKILYGDNSSAQGLIIVPYPRHCNKFLIVSILAANVTYNNFNNDKGKIKFNIIDYSLVRYPEKQSLLEPVNELCLADNFTEGLAATIHSNKQDYWIIACTDGANAGWYAIPITDNGIECHKSIFSSDKRYRPDVMNNISISPNSKYIENNKNLYVFDNSNGSIKHILAIDTVKTKDGKSLKSSNMHKNLNCSEFSSSSKYLYYTIYYMDNNPLTQGYNIVQIDIEKAQRGEPSAILLKYPFNKEVRNYSISLAPDSSIYFISGFDNLRFIMNRIKNPNLEGEQSLLEHKLMLIDTNQVKKEERINLTVKGVQFPNFSHHVFDPNYKRIPTLCDLPKMLPFDTSICVGEWLTLSPKFESLPTMNLWQWEAKNADIKTGNDSLFTTRFLSTGTFPVRFIGCNANGCDTNSIQVTVYEKPTIVPAPDYTLCPGESVRIGRMNTPVFEYSWSPPDYLDNPKSANPLCTPEKNMQYILTVKNSNGCENYDTVNVTLGGELSVFAGADTSVCEGEQIQLNASGAENFSWSPADGLSNANIANPIFTGTSTTQYIVTGKSGNCEGKDTILVTVNEKPIIIASENREICAGDTVHLSAKGAKEYSWSPAEGLNNATIANPIFNGTKTTEYIVTGKNGNCSDSKKVIITVNEKPTISVSENREICAGDTVHLSAKGALEYSWSPADGLDNATIANPIFNGTKTTEYIVTGKTGNCFDSKKILITVNEKPTISVSENREICLGDTVHLRANNADSYLWTPSTYLNNATIANPIAQPSENITYTVRGTNANGCYEEKTISITINNDQEKTISLQLSDTAHYAPGTIVPVKIVIPAGLAQITATLNYDPCCVRCDSIFTPNAGISTVFLRNNALRFTSISPNKQEKEIILPCTIYLPPDGRKSEKFTLSDIIHSEQCLIVRANNDEILYDPSCAWQFRGVQQTGSFGIESDGTIARLYTGYGGTITVKIFDLTGVEVWHSSSLYNSTDMQEISLPSLSSGIYIMQASNGVWHDECVMMK